MTTILEKITLEQYRTAVKAFICLAQQPTSGGRVAAQVILSAYNGAAFQLDVSSLCNLDRNNFETAMIVIRGRYDTGYEPHSLILDGSKILRQLWDQWSRLHVETRGLPECPNCDGRGTVYLSDDEDDIRTKPCPRCEGKGKVCAI